MNKLLDIASEYTADGIDVETQKSIDVPLYHAIMNTIFIAKDYASTDGIGSDCVAIVRSGKNVYSRLHNELQQTLLWLDDMGEWECDVQVAGSRIDIFISVNGVDYEYTIV